MTKKRAGDFRRLLVLICTRVMRHPIIASNLYLRRFALVDVISPEGLVDILKIRPIARMGYFDYTSVDSKFRMVIPGDQRALRVQCQGGAGGVDDRGTAVGGRAGAGVGTCVSAGDGLAYEASGLDAGDGGAGFEGRGGGEAEGGEVSFGAEEPGRIVTIPGFAMATTPATQALWCHVMGEESLSSTYHYILLPV